MGEGVFFLPTGNLALVTFQKDNSKGTRFGSRVVVFDTDKVESKYDLQLPRNHPECNIEGNLKEHGPNPEVAFIAPKSDTLALTLDLYGAIAFTKLSSALEGKWENLEYISCAQDGSFGNAFPDRGCLFETGGKEHLLISNASPNGGLVLFDVAAHKVEQKFAASAGAENPVFLSRSQKVVTCISGKIKTRAGEKQDKIYKPGKRPAGLRCRSSRTGEGCHAGAHYLRQTGVSRGSSRTWGKQSYFPGAGRPRPGERPWYSTISTNAKSSTANPPKAKCRG